MTQQPENYTPLLKQISRLYTDTRESTLTAYWLTGKYISNTEEQHRNSGGEEKASVYGKKLIRHLSKDLSEKFGKGFSETNIKYMRRFYRLNQKSQPVARLEWSKYVLLFQVKDEEERGELERLAAEENLTRYQLKKFIGIYRLRRREEAPRDAGEEARPERGALYSYTLAEKGKVPLEKGEALVDCGFNIRRRVTIENIRNLEEKTAFKLKKADGKYFLSKTLDGNEKKLLYTYRGYVEEVIDGDTIRVNVDLGFYTLARQKIRLRGVDTPEREFPEGKRAGNFVRRALGKCPFIIIKTYKTDMYDRYVSDLFYLPGENDPDRVAAEGKHLNHELIRMGLGIRI